MYLNQESLSPQSDGEPREPAPSRDYYGVVTEITEKTFLARLQDPSGVLYDAEIAQGVVRDGERHLIKRDAQFCLRVVERAESRAPVSAELAFLELEAPTQEEVDAAYLRARDAAD